MVAVRGFQRIRGRRFREVEQGGLGAHRTELWNHLEYRLANINRNKSSLLNVARRPKSQGKEKRFSSLSQTKRPLHTFKTLSPLGGHDGNTQVVFKNIVLVKHASFHHQHDFAQTHSHQPPHRNFIKRKHVKHGLELFPGCRPGPASADQSPPPTPGRVDPGDRRSAVSRCQGPGNHRPHVISTPPHLQPPRLYKSRWGTWLKATTWNPSRWRSNSASPRRPSTSATTTRRAGMWTLGTSMPSTRA